MHPFAPFKLALLCWLDCFCGDSGIPGDSEEVHHQWMVAAADWWYRSSRRHNFSSSPRQDRSQGGPRPRQLLAKTAGVSSRLATNPSATKGPSRSPELFNALALHQPVGMGETGIRLTVIRHHRQRKRRTPICSTLPALADT